jgi:hypothetical protein
MKTLGCLTIALCIFLGRFSLNAQPYSVPGAQQQPAWVFPLWFEDGSGQKDTLYYCYDPLAGNAPWDTIFGEHLMSYNSNSLDMTFDNAFLGDSMRLKTIVLDSDFQYIGVNIWAYELLMPLIIRYDVNVLNSTALPFANQNPSPLAQVQLFYDYPTATDGCYPEYPIIISDTLVGGNFCYKPDSILFSGTGLSYLLFQVVPWTGYYLSIAPSNSYSINIYPNPVSKFLYVNSKMNKGTSRISISDVLGKQIVTAYDTNKIDVSQLPSGLYVCSYKDDSFEIRKKILIEH